MELRDITPDDLPLYEGFYGDPRMMKHLGGAWPKERIPQKLRQNLEVVEAGTAWIYKVVESEQAAGLVCIWEHEWRGEQVNELGWAILPALQGRGLATRAVRAMLDKARREGRWDIIHALPAPDNAPSNGVCRNAGFTLIEECEVEWNGRVLRCNHWLLDLRSTP
jgi:RimJ/RimL family protein N-acetyltransferase